MCMAQAYYRKWRPATWDQVVGQEPIVHTLRNAVTLQKQAHAYLFSGPRGTGKTSTARILAKALNCTDPQREQRPCDQCENCKAINEARFMDLIEIDAASNTSVDDVRDLREKVNFSPTQGSFKVYIIDEVHMLSTAAFNALLKTLEEPPSHAIFILATTEIHKIPATVLSRCQRYEFRQIPLNYIIALLQQIADKEELQYEPDALSLIARQATGSLRDAISLLDQIASTGDAVSMALTESVLGTTSDQKVVDMLDALIQHEANAGITLLHEALDSGTDARQFANQVVNYLRSMLLIKVGNDGDVETTPDAKQKMREQSEMISIQDLTEWIHSFNQALYNMSARWQPSLALEMALVECVGADVAVRTEMIKTTEKRSEEPASKKNVKSQEPVVSNPPEEEPSSTAAVQLEEQVEEKQLEQESTEEEVAQPEGSTENASGDEAAPSKDDLLSRWKEIRSLVRKQKPQTAALLNSCKSINLEGKRLKLGFESDLLRSKMDTDINREVTREAIQELLGIDVHIDCQVVKNGLNNHIDQATEDHGSLVKTALSLGGEIKEKE